MTLLQELINYSHDIIRDTTSTCLKHRWACMRFLNDLDRRGSSDFPYEFNEAKAERFLSWMRLFKHRKGVLRGQHIEPVLIQKFIFGNIYGWTHKTTGYRRFNKFYWQVARKNAKSQSLACVASYETLAFDESGLEACETYCVATKTEQARIVYDETVAMLEGCKLLKDKFKVAYGRIVHLKTGSLMRVLSEEDRKTGDGLNPQCGVVDEYHAHDTSEAYDIIDSGMGARAQPLLGIISTAGFDLMHPCYRVEYDLISKILNPDVPVNLDNYFAMVNELEKDIEGNLTDDIKNPACWIKANPIICAYPEGRGYLHKKLAEALEAPEKMRNFLTKHMDIWVNQREAGYMDAAKWAVCKGEIPDLDGAECYVGVDMSAKIDLTSVTFEFRHEDKYVVLSHSFIPADTLEQKRKTDKVPYEMWAAEGWITITSGAVVDYRKLKEYVFERAKAENWTILEWCVDPWGAGTTLGADLVDEGKQVVEVVQGIKTLSEPTKDFREMVLSKRVIHDGNPVLSWALSNAIVDEVDRNKNIILNKKKSRERIDPVAATINAHVRAMVGESAEKESRVVFI